MNEAFDLLSEALSAQYGIAISTDQQKLLRQRLYTARKQNLPLFRQLSVLLIDDEVWIVNTEGVQDMNTEELENPVGANVEV